MPINGVNMTFLFVYRSNCVFYCTISKISPTNGLWLSNRRDRCDLI